MANTEFVFDHGTTYDLYPLDQIITKAKSGEISIEDAVRMAYANGLHDMTTECADRAVKMSTVKEHAYMKAVGTHEISRSAESLWKAVMDE